MHDIRSTSIRECKCWEDPCRCRVPCCRVLTIATYKAIQASQGDAEEGKLVEILSLFILTTDNYKTFWPIFDRILHPKSSLKHIPIKLYLQGKTKITVHQALVSPMINPEAQTRRDKDDTVQEASIPQTIGTALNSHLRGLFPSRRTCVVAKPVLHGRAMKMSDPLVEVFYTSMYPDGFLHISIIMMS